MSETGSPFETRSRIFVVDDELEIAKMLTVVSQMNLFDATAYTDPHEAAGCLARSVSVSGASALRKLLEYCGVHAQTQIRKLSARIFPPSK